jgi:hypothetical protein
MSCFDIRSNRFRPNTHVQHIRLQTFQGAQRLLRDQKQVLEHHR